MTDTTRPGGAGTKRFVLRVWLPDKPGALGRVASAVGSVGASLVGIDILEQSGGRAIDELVVDAVDSPNAQEKLIAALTFVEGVSIEEIEHRSGEVTDAGSAALEMTADLVEQVSALGLQKTLVERVTQDFGAAWAALVPLGRGDLFATSGEVPSPAWLAAFLAGSRESAAATAGQPAAALTGPDDVAWVELPRLDAALVVSRDGRAFRARERRQLAALARIADALLTVNRAV